MPSTVSNSFVPLFPNFPNYTIIVGDDVNANSIDTSPSLSSVTETHSIQATSANLPIVPAANVTSDSPVKIPTIVPAANVPSDFIFCT